MTCIPTMKKQIFIASFLFLFLAGCTLPRTSKAWPTPTEVKPQGVSVVDGKFVSDSGRFSISIPAMPMKTMDIGTEKARAKGVDVGKQFTWQFDETFYTIMYIPSVDSDGNPFPIVYKDMVMGSRKGVSQREGKDNI